MGSLFRVEYSGSRSLLSSNELISKSLRSYFFMTAYEEILLLKNKIRGFLGLVSSEINSTCIYAYAYYAFSTVFPFWRSLLMSSRIVSFWITILSELKLEINVWRPSQIKLNVVWNWSATQFHNMWCHQPITSNP